MQIFQIIHRFIRNQAIVSSIISRQLGANMLSHPLQLLRRFINTFDVFSQQILLLLSTFFVYLN